MGPLRGVYVPIVTPYADDGSVAEGALEGLARRLLDDAAAGLVPLGTAGEGALLTDEERRLVVEVCGRVCAERGAALIAGAGGNDTRRTVEEVAAIGAMHGVTAVLCLVPYYLRPTQAGIVAHFEAVAAASPVPIVVYNIPSRTGVRASAETLMRLAELESVIGVKQSVGALDDDTQWLLAGAPRDFAILCGDDAHLAAVVLLGGGGGITASAHLATREWVALVEAARAGSRDEVRRLQASLLPVAETGFAEPSPAVFKAVLHDRGEIPTPDVRLPFVRASAESLRTALAAVSSAES